MVINVFIFLILLSSIDGQFNLHSTHFVNEYDSYYDCLYYKVSDNMFNYFKAKDFVNPYQIIKYCICPLENPIERMMAGNVLANYTFEQLKQLNTTVEDLFSWSAPIDLAEQYQVYIDELNSSLQSEIFYQCESPWFGVFCQYTFDLEYTFDNIVKETFEAKKYGLIPFNIGSILINITNVTCYVHLGCNRGPAPICLD